MTSGKLQPSFTSIILVCFFSTTKAKSILEYLQYTRVKRVATNVAVSKFGTKYISCLQLGSTEGANLRR